MLKHIYVFYKVVSELMVDGWETFPFLSLEEIAYCVIILSDFLVVQAVAVPLFKYSDMFIHS